MPDAVLFGASTICKSIGRSIGVWTAYLHNFVPLILSLLLAATVHAETLTGRVVRVADGDTITVLEPSPYLPKAVPDKIATPASFRR